MSFFKSDIFKLFVSLFCITAIVALLLAGVNALTKDKIAERQRESELATVRQFYDYNAEFEKSTTPDGEEYFIAKSPDSGNILGYAANVASKGYGGDIQLMVCFNTFGEVNGVGVVSMSETSGVGTRIVDDATFMQQFAGKKPTFSWVKAATGNKSEIVTLTGASVSSKAAVNGVNAAYALLSNADLFSGN